MIISHINKGWLSLGYRVCVSETVCEALVNDPYFEQMSSSFAWTSPTVHCTTISCYVDSLNGPLWNFSSHLPFTNINLITTLVFFYLLTLSIVRLRRPHPVFRGSAFTNLAIFHNTLLSFLSLLLNLCATFSILTLGPLQCFCQASSPSGAAAWALYAFYLSKLYELADSFILALRGSELTVLHVWHHASVIFETWSWGEIGMLFALYGMWFNTAVHVFMYAYYALRLAGRDVWWKKWITVAQIVQFISSFILSVPFVVMRLGGHMCRGSPALLVSVFCNGSYLWLFVRFYRKTYTGTRREKMKSQ